MRSQWVAEIDEIYAELKNKEVELQSKENELLSREEEIERRNNELEKKNIEMERNECTLNKKKENVALQEQVCGHNISMFDIKICNFRKSVVLFIKVVKQHNHCDILVIS